MNPPGTVRVLLPFIRRESLALVVAAIATVALVAAELAAPWPLKFALDHLATSAGREDVATGFLLTLGAAVLAIAVFGALASYQSDLRLLVAGERIIHELRLALYAQLQRLRISFHHRTPTGDLVTRVTADVDAIGEAFANSLEPVFLIAAPLGVVAFVLALLLRDKPMRERPATPAGGPAQVPTAVE